MNFDVRAMCRGVCIVATTFALGALVASPAAAQVYAYPLNGQSAKQQQNDEVACDRWAIDRTGFDPRQPPAYYGGQTGGGPSGSVQSGAFGRGTYGQGGGLADAGKGAGRAAVVATATAVADM